MNVLVHMSLFIDEFRNNIQLLSKKLGVTGEKIEKIILNLKNIGLVTEDNGKYFVSMDTIHLPANSPICTPHQNLMRQAIISFYSDRDVEKSYNLLLTFTADDKSRKLIQDRFINFLKEANRIIKDAPSKNLYQMNFDLFSWT